MTFTSLPYRFDLEEPSAYMGIEDCEDGIVNDMVISVQFTATFNIQESRAVSTFTPYLTNFYTFEAGEVNNSSPTCGTSGCSQISDSDVTFNGTSATPSISFTDLTGLSNSADCTSQSLDREYFIRADVFDPNGASPADARIVLDTGRPDPAESFTALATEDTLQVTWVNTPSEDLRGYRVIYSKKTFTAGQTPESILATDSSLKTRDITTSSNDINTGSASVALTPGDTIYVGLAAIDEVGNASIVVGPQSVEVIDTVDFWEDYLSRGGSEDGGYCAAAPSGLPATPPAALGLLGLLSLGLRRRRS